MNCPCDEITFPPALNIAAGLPALPRQIASFPEFRAWMLHLIPSKGPLAPWRARSSQDFGIMLLEMWAYVCDATSFYDQVKTDEFFLRTAQLRPSVRMLIELLGYVPRPAVAASVDLAVMVDGRQPLTLPAGTAFRSGALPGGPPQTFELVQPAKAHPFLNRWTIAPNRPPTIDGGKKIPWLDLVYLRLDPATNKLKKGSIFLFEIAGTSSFTTARTVRAISDFAAKDGSTYKKIEWDRPIAIPGSTPVANIRLTMPTRVGHLTTKDNTASQPPVNTMGSVTFLHFDAIYNGLPVGAPVVVEKNQEVRSFRIVSSYLTDIVLAPASKTNVTDSGGTVTSVVETPQITKEVSDIELDVSINDPARKPYGAADWDSSDALNLNVHFAFVDAATVVAPAWTTLIQGDPLNLLGPVETPQDGKSPSVFEFEDKNGAGFEPTGSVSFNTANLSLDTTTPIPGALATPVNVYGNIVTAVRGETVPMEVLGAGDASLNQRFKLKKSPLTYTASGGTDSGVASSLAAYVDGVMWAETPSFYGAKEGDQIYIVRQDDNGDTFLTFNDRLKTGSVVTATYRFGAGKAAPPAGSIQQIARPVPGLKSVKDPVPAYGGDDAEPAFKMRVLAPRSALLLGRAISIPDMQAAAAGAPGVRAASAEWNWSVSAQRAVVHVYYIGAPSLKTSLLKRLRSLASPTTPIVVDQAIGVPSTLSISIAIDPKRLEADVLPAVRSALMDPDAGLLAPERIGIGQALFRSRILDAVLAVPGTTSVDGLFWDGKEFTHWGLSPGAGHYFDLEAGALLLNGKAGTNG